MVMMKRENDFSDDIILMQSYLAMPPEQDTMAGMVRLCKRYQHTIDNLLRRTEYAEGQVKRYQATESVLTDRLNMLIAESARRAAIKQPGGIICRQKSFLKLIVASLSAFARFARAGFKRGC